MLPIALLAIFGIIALWMATGRSELARRWAPVVGMFGHLACLWCYSGEPDLWLPALSLAYTVVYTRAAWVQWRCNWSVHE